MLGTTSAPLWCGSSTDFRVAAPVELAASVVEFHTAASAVKSATPLLPSGAGGAGSGQLPLCRIGSLLSRP